MATGLSSELASPLQAGPLTVELPCSRGDGSGRGSAGNANPVAFLAFDTKRLNVWIRVPARQWLPSLRDRCLTLGSSETRANVPLPR